MNLREEIEKMPICECGEVHIVDVLALLDQYELVGEHIFKGEGKISILDPLRWGYSWEDIVEGKPGDRITIYRKEASDEREERFL